jgi:hypothetical protein
MSTGCPNGASESCMYAAPAKMHEMMSIIIMHPRVCKKADMFRSENNF